LNVPGSLSSPLQTTYFSSPEARRVEPTEPRVVLRVPPADRRRVCLQEAANRQVVPGRHVRVRVDLPVGLVAEGHKPRVGIRRLRVIALDDAQRDPLQVIGGSARVHVVVEVPLAVPADAARRGPVAPAQA
jgi:hypothetical protein